MNFIFSGKFYLIICFVFCFVFLTLEQEKKIMRNWNKTEWAQDRSFQNKIWCFFQNLVSPKCLLCLLTSICITTVTQQTHLCWPRVGRCGSATGLCVEGKTTLVNFASSSMCHQHQHLWRPGCFLNDTHLPRSGGLLLSCLFQQDDAKALRAREPLAYVG